MSLQLASSFRFIQFTPATKPVKKQSFDDLQVVVYKLLKATCMSRALSASLLAVLSNVEAVIKGKKVIVSL